MAWVEQGPWLRPRALPQQLLAQRQCLLVVVVMKRAQLGPLEHHNLR